MIEKRLQRLHQQQAAHGLDYVALMPGANLRYLTGLNLYLFERPIVFFFPREGRPAAIVPTLEVPRVEADLPFEAELFVYSDEEGHQPAFERACRALNLPGKRLGVEFLNMRVLELKQLEKYAPGCQTLDAGGVLSQLRMTKGAEEIEYMRQAIRITEQALQQVADFIQPDRTDSETVAELKIAFLRAGAEGMSFEPIVGVGPDSASSHVVPSGRVIEPGDLIVIDCGVTYQGYIADITRTFAVGPVAPQWERVYEIVKEANAAGRAAVRPGVPAQEVDRAARQVIAQAGYGEYFVHRTGHGLGLEVHEPPYIVEGNEELLQAGMTFTVEPGIYLPGQGGVRIEDDVLVTSQGAETLTTFPRDQFIVKGQQLPSRSAGLPNPGPK
jgi:Xaa-Pro dipeptidase